MYREENLTIDLKVKEYNPLRLKQMDTTKLNIELIDNALPINLIDLNINIIFTKPNKTIVIQSTNITKNNNTITVLLLEDCLRISGNSAKMEIELKNDSEIVSSFFIPIIIEPTSKENIQSDNTPNYFEEFAIAIDKFKVESAEMLEEISAAEETRIVNEKNRVSAENTRKANETKRVTAETAREEAETARAAAEEKRIAAETARATAEEKRIAAENTRVEAEKARVTAEANRVTEFNEMIQNVDVQAVLELRTMLMEAISPITTEDGAYITTEDEEMIIYGL